MKSKGVLFYTVRTNMYVTKMCVFKTPKLPKNRLTKNSKPVHTYECNLS